jgi:hypothetical protein
MKITEAQRAKLELQRQIYELLRDYESSTGLKVRQVIVNRVHMVAKPSELESVEVTVEL